MYFHTINIIPKILIAFYIIRQFILSACCFSVVSSTSPADSLSNPLVQTAHWILRHAATRNQNGFGSTETTRDETFTNQPISLPQFRSHHSDHLPSLFEATPFLLKMCKPPNSANSVPETAKGGNVALNSLLNSQIVPHQFSMPETRFMQESICTPPFAFGESDRTAAKWNELRRIPGERSVNSNQTEIERIIEANNVFWNAPTSNAMAESAQDSSWTEAESTKTLDHVGAIKSARPQYMQYSDEVSAKGHNNDEAVSSLDINMSSQFTKKEDENLNKRESSDVKRMRMKNPI